MSGRVDVMIGIVCFAIGALSTFLALRHRGRIKVSRRGATEVIMTLRTPVEAKDFEDWIRDIGHDDDVEGFEDYHRRMEHNRRSDERRKVAVANRAAKLEQIKTKGYTEDDLLRMGYKCQCERDACYIHSSNE